MILQALTVYYEEMLHKGKISAPGWDETFRVSFQLEIDDTGALVDGNQRKKAGASPLPDARPRA